ncbi:MAG TPA: serine/threonine-protein kinase, partial [Steroidobacteraceae bacterium]|nr:serine/threonine-protein kinase [Steroidobacteraceae bacterium]
MSLSRERELFEACLELDGAARAALLARECTSPAERARIEALLDAHERAADSPTSVIEQAATLIEARVGPYRLLERIGEGGIGEVYLAEQTEPVRRRVAVKILRAGMDSREVLARFDLERQTLALMEHPNVARILDAGTTTAGQPYVVVEYVPGVPITRYCDDAQLGIDERLELFKAVCAGVQHAHQRGIIHRDLKPSNILVTELDDEPVPKIIDFGIAKATTPQLDVAQPHTRLGHLVGTPDYMSPEQAELSPLDIDTRADIYALGVVLNELLTGGLPYPSSQGES